MADEFAQRMLDLANNSALPEAVRDKATATLKQWHEGISPSEKTLEYFRKAEAPAGDCSRVANDGACEWLRKYGEGYGLPVPPMGERALCIYPSINSQCPGFKKMRSK